MIKRDGKFYVIDRFEDFRLIQVVFNDSGKIVYKVYKGKELLDKWKSTEDLHDSPISAYYDSKTYDRFLEIVDEYIDQEDDDDDEYNLFGNYTYDRKGVHSTPSYYNPTYGSTRSASSYGSSYTYKPQLKKTGFFDEYTKSNTLVFHKTDNSTTMLSQIYEGKGWDVFRETYDLDKEELYKVVDAHERIVCLGHGGRSGLIGMFGTDMAPHFANKKLFVIWCNADAYFTDANIGDGQFITGNMPSEVWECRAAGCGQISTQEMLDNITYWSKLCADVAEQCLEGNVQSSVNYIRTNYIEKYGDHAVTRYNAIRTKVQGTSMEENTKQVDDLYAKLGKEIPKVIEPEYKTYYGTGSTYGSGTYSGGGSGSKFSLFDREDEKQAPTVEPDVIDADFEDKN